MKADKKRKIFNGIKALLALLAVIFTLIFKKDNRNEPKSTDG